MRDLCIRYNEMLLLRRAYLRHATR
jgi:hypothetical protein